MKRVWAILFGVFAISIATTACSQKVAYKPYLPEQFRGEPGEPDPSIPGIFTGKKRGYTIYGR